MQPDDVVVAPGASNCLDSLLFSICEPRDSVLVLAPYWSKACPPNPLRFSTRLTTADGFDVHFVLRPSIKIVPVHTQSASRLDRPADLLSESLLPALERAFASAREDGAARVRALVVTNPHNPFARCYPAHVLREAMEWCAARGLHYVSGEVYALSDFSQDGDGDEEEHGDGPAPAPFVSALSIDLPPDKTPPVSVIWSTSKDLGSSGLRVGVHVSRRRRAPAAGSAPSNGRATMNGDAEKREDDGADASDDLLATSLGLLTTTQLPTVSMLLTRCLLTSPAFDTLVARNRLRLRRNHDMVARRLRKWGVPFVPATSGPFLLARLGAAVVVDDDDGSGGVGEGGVSAAKRRTGSGRGDAVDVVALLRDKARVLVSPGKVYHMGGDAVGGGGSVDDGWVRITFAVPVHVLKDALNRIGEALGLEKRRWECTIL